MGLLITTLLILGFALLAVIDGFYLHIFKYQLFNYVESEFEHITHTIRSILFPLIVYLLFIKHADPICFYTGILIVFIDIIVLAIDAYSEKDSRSFMGGLPKWEYILHLFVNGFHFASIAVFLSLKFQFSENGIEMVEDLSGIAYFKLFRLTIINLIPGAILLALIHLLTSFKLTKQYWNTLRAKIMCC